MTADPTELIHDLQDLMSKHVDVLGTHQFTYDVMTFAVIAMLNNTPSRKNALDHIQHCVNDILSAWQEVSEE